MSTRTTEENKMDYLSAIPVELLLMVYEELLVTDGFVPVDTPTPANMLAIMQTSSWHLQAAETFYSKNEFLFTCNAAQPLGPIASGNLHFLRKIAISLCTDHPDLPTTLDRAQLIKAPAVANLKLDQVSVEVCSKLHPLIVDHFDDSLLTQMHPFTYALCFLIRSRVVKHLRIRLNAARFATNTVAVLQKVFRENHQAKATLTFYVGSSYASGNIVTDTTKCERAVTGTYHNSPVSVGDFVEEDLTFDNIDDMSMDDASDMEDEEGLDAAVMGMVTFAPELFL
ncbi:hypothetical protein BU16DRAFT_43631 [Lophium mytilinum]|uniref:Uncharacterized protein n=1 Tax=Lophium mytilinum TaxID=390894 RepID=A0A6A6QQ43_9PEZI|nr:hypothetical protein BU16DRAFT_43631 [Lophium mytilinum]